MSVRSLFLPLFAMQSAKSRKVGVESTTSLSSRRKNGARSLANGLVTLVSSLSSSRAPRSSTNVVLARRSVPGRNWSAWASATFSSAIAAHDRVRVGDEAGDVVTPLGERRHRAARRRRGSARRPSGRPTAPASPPRWSTSDGPKYLKVSFSSPPLPTYQPEKPVSTFWSERRVFGSRVLKSWSRSTGAVVLSVAISDPSSSSGALLGPGCRDDVAVRDARQRGLTRIDAVVPSCSGTKSSLIVTVISAWLSSVSSILVILPTFLPATWTWLPFTS